MTISISAGSSALQLGLTPARSPRPPPATAPVGTVWDAVDNRTRKGNFALLVQAKHGRPPVWRTALIVDHCGGGGMAAEVEPPTGSPARRSAQLEPLPLPPGS